jgi:hypothetical protein
LGDAITERTASLASDAAAIRDRSDHRVIHFFDTTNGKPIGDGKITHTV